MKDLLLYIARNLVDDPDAVTVTEVQGDQELTLELRVAPEDMGKVIGRQGDPHRGTLLRPAHRNQGFCGYRRLTKRERAFRSLFSSPPGMPPRGSFSPS